MRSTNLEPAANENARSRSLVIIDNDTLFSDRAAAAFKQDGWLVVCSHQCPPPGPADWLPHLVAVDVCPNGAPDLSIVRQARRAFPQTFLMALTAYPSLSIAVEALRQGADDCVLKPGEPRELLSACVWHDRKLGDGDATLPSLAKVEWEYLSRVLMLHHGNISAAARALGIRRSTLQRKLKKYPPSR